MLLICVCLTNYHALSLIYIIIYTQIVKVANVPNITPQGVMNFVAVTVLAIKEWQVIRQSDGITKKELVGDILVKLAASVSHISEVNSL